MQPEWWVPLTRVTQSVVRRLRPVVLVVALLGLASVDLSWPSPTLAKDVDVVGTVDCGVRSGRRCSLDDTLVLLTDSLTGANKLVVIDIRWIKRKLPALDQDDEITLSVELLPDGTLRALGVVSAERRDGTINQGMSTGSVEVRESRRRRGEQQDRDQDANPTPARPVQGGLSGTVTSLLTGTPIAGATVRLNGLTATTGATGAYALPQVEPGSYRVEASAAGFITLTQSTTIQGAGASELNFALATAFPNLNFTLVWGAQPSDLDAHLSGPSSSPPSRFHVFWQNKNPEAYARLTTDTQTGFGPERIIISPNPATLQYVAGDYHFWVDNPNAQVGPNYSGSQARVIVNRNGDLLGDFDVGAAIGDPNRRLWHVVDVQIDAAGNATVRPVQQFTAGDLFTVLAPPYGTKPPRR